MLTPRVIVVSCYTILAAAIADIDISLRRLLMPRHHYADAIYAATSYAADAAAATTCFRLRYAFDAIDFSRRYFFRYAIAAAIWYAVQCTLLPQSSSTLLPPFDYFRRLLSSLIAA